MAGMLWPEQSICLSIHRVKRGRTLVQYNLAAAAPAAGGDPRLLFTFATGRDARVCAFREFFLAFFADVQAALA
jgi:hypothetical protein